MANERPGALVYNYADSSQFSDAALSALRKDWALTIDPTDHTKTLPYQAVFIVIDSAEFNSFLMKLSLVDELLTTIPERIPFFFILPEEEAFQSPKGWAHAELKGLFTNDFSQSDRHFTITSLRTILTSRPDQLTLTYTNHDSFIITFDPSLTPEQIVATLTALANYYRVCGGAGLPANFQTEEAMALEDANV